MLRAACGHRGIIPIPAPAALRIPSFRKSQRCYHGRTRIRRVLVTDDFGDLSSEQEVEAEWPLSWARFDRAGACARKECAGEVIAADDYGVCE